MLIRLLYTSHMTPGMTASDVRRLVAEAQPRNRRMDITGVLLRCDHHFVQAIEGREEVVQDLMRRIKSDHRHFDVKLFVHEPTVKRLFDSWAMGYVERLDALKDLERLSSGDMSPADFFELMRAVIEDERMAPLRRTPEDL